MTRKVYQADFGSPSELMVLAAASNPITNGGFEVWQRGTSFAAAVSGYYTDRWYYTKASGAGVHTILQSTDVPAVAATVPTPQSSIQLDVTTAQASVLTNDTCRISHRLEGYDWAPFAQRQFTLGFWVKDTITGIHCVNFWNSGYDRSYIAEYTITTADTWEYKTITVPASPAAGTWNSTTGTGLDLSWVLASGPTDNSTPGSWLTGFFSATSSQVNALSSTANNFRLWGITLGAGPTVAPYWPRTYQQELARCQRMAYVERPGASAAPFSGSGYAVSTTALHYITQFPVTMRGVPTPAMTAAATYAVHDGVTNTALSVAPALSAASPHACRFVLTVASGLTQFRPYNLRDNTGAATLTYSADI